MGASVTAVLVGILLMLGVSEDAARAECRAADNRLVIETEESRVFLCEGRRLVGEYAAHLGRGGTGKTRQGDNKVPLGVYTLGTPRKSETFWIFIPIGYPTPEQKKKGFTGSDVGVHGPHRKLRWLGPLTNTFSSTAGCIGLGRDADIEEVAAWVNAKRVRTIEIR